MNPWKPISKNFIYREENKKNHQLHGLLEKKLGTTFFDRLFQQVKPICCKIYRCFQTTVKQFCIMKKLYADINELNVV